MVADSRISLTSCGTGPVSSTHGVRASFTPNEPAPPSSSSSAFTGMQGLLEKSVYFATIDGVASFPEVIAAIRAAVSDKDATPASVARAVERDVAFSSRLLRMVNAPEIGLIRPCVSVAYAVSLIGMSRIAMLAEATASRAAMEQCASVAPEIAARASTHAAIARFLAAIVGAPAEQAFTAALLGDVGTVAILATQPRHSVAGTGLLAAERESFGFDHAELGGEILRRWNLPSPIPDVVSLHHDLEAARERGPEVARLVALMQAAELLAPRVVDENAVVTLEALADLAAHPAFMLLSMDAEKLVTTWPAMAASLQRDSSNDLDFEEKPSSRYIAKAAPSKYRAVWIALAILVPATAVALAALLQ